MRGLIFLICLGISFLSQAQVILKETEIQKKQQNTTEQFTCGRAFPIKIASFPSNPPFGWSKRTGTGNNGIPIYTSEGYGIDVFNTLAKELDLNTTSIGFTNYEQALNALITGEADVLAGVYYNPAMLSSSLNILMPAYFLNPLTIYFRADAPIKALKFEDLIPYKGLIRQEEALYPVLFEQLPKDLDLKTVSGSEAAFEALLDGKVDYVLGSLYALESEKNRLKLGNLIDHNRRILVNYGLFFAFSPVSQCRKLQPAFSEKLKEFMAGEESNILMTNADNLWRSYFPESAFLKEMGIKEQETLVELPLTPMILDLETAEESTAIPQPPMLSDEEAGALGGKETPSDQVGEETSRDQTPADSGAETTVETMGEQESLALSTSADTPAEAATEAPVKTPASVKEASSVSFSDSSLEKSLKTPSVVLELPLVAEIPAASQPPAIPQEITEPVTEADLPLLPLATDPAIPSLSREEAVDLGVQDDIPAPAVIPEVAAPVAPENLPVTQEIRPEAQPATSLEKELMPKEKEESQLSPSLLMPENKSSVFPTDPHMNAVGF